MPGDLLKICIIYYIINKGMADLVVYATWARLNGVYIYINRVSVTRGGAALIGLCKARSLTRIDCDIDIQLI